MLSDKFRKGDRCLTLLIGVVFATVTSTPISAQPRTPLPPQPSTTETPKDAETKQPVRALGGQLAVIPGVHRAEFSRDGSQILTTSWDNTARLWDTKGNLLVEFRGHEGQINSAVFSPNSSQILTASNDKTARLWDTKGHLLAVLRHEREVGSAVFSPNGSQILTSSEIRRLWDTSGNLLIEFKDEYQADIVAFSPDSSQILTFSNSLDLTLSNNLYDEAAPMSEPARLWDTEGNLLGEFQGDKKEWVALRNAVFSPDGKQILTANKDNTARLWDTKGNLLAKFQHEQGEISYVEFSPDGRQILTAGGDKTARLWDTKGNLLNVFKHKDYVSTAEFRPGASQILTQSLDRTTRLWDTKGNLLAVFRGYEGWGINATFSPDGKQILIVNYYDRMARLWDVSVAIASQSQQIATLQAFQDGVSERNAQLTIFKGHEGNVNSAVFSPDGRQILTASSDKTARLWDTKGNLLSVFRGHEGNINSAVFSPDGRQILTASSDKTARLWDTKGNLLSIFRGHEDWVNSAAFSPDGRQILTASSDKTARLWDTQGNLLSVFRGHKGNVNRAVFTPNGSQILTASFDANPWNPPDNTARLWDTKGNLLAVFQGHEGSIGSASSLDQRQIFTIKDKIAYLWDTKGKLLTVFRGHEEQVNSAVFSPHDRQILTASNDKTARLWDTKGNLLAIFRGHEAQVNSAVFSPDGRQILTASDDNTARLWSVSAAIAVHPTFQEGVSDSNAQKAVFRGHEGNVSSALFSPDGRQVLTISSEDKTARLWNTQGNLLSVLKEVYSASFSPDGRRILTDNEDGTVRLWDTQGNLLTVLRNDLTVGNAIFSPNGRQILTASPDLLSDPTARLWDTQGNLLVVFQGHQKKVNSTVFSPDGRQILTASDDKTARLWDTQGNLLVVFQGHEDSVTRAIFNPDGRRILTASRDGTARLWDSKGNPLAVFQFRKYGALFYSAVFSRDGNQILMDGRTALAWNILGNTVAPFLNSLDYKDVANSVNGIVFSPDGNQILTAGDNAAYLWDSKGNLLAVFRHEKKVNSAVFSPDGHQILTASDDTTARLWDVSAGIQVSAPEIAFQQGIQLDRKGTFESRKLAIQKLEESLKLYHAAGNRAKEAQILLSMGQSYRNLGQFQAALDSYNQALPLSRQAGAKAEEAAILNSLGELYNDLADPKTALDYYNQAFPLWYQLNDKGGAATILNNIGSINTTLGKQQNALDSYNQALTISRSGGDKAAEAASLISIGGIYTTSKEWSDALNAYNQALIISRFLKDKVKETTVLNQIGKVHAASGQESTAKDYYNQALLLSRQLGYKSEEANILYNQATLNRQQNNLTAAKTEIETAINIIESLRTQIASQELRQSYFARNQDYYQFYIDLLMQLHQQNSNQGYDGHALHISERARARSLLELLTEATANIRQGVDPKLLEQERNLQQQLNAFEHRKYQLQSGHYNEQELNEIKQKIDTVLAQLKQIETKIRVTSPRYAALKYPEPLNLQQIQQQVLDDDTLLLEYALGPERSYLWAVTKNSITSYLLPKRSEIEAAAQTFGKAVTQNSTATIDSGLPLSQMLLAPVSNQLGNKRLLIVGDGALQYVPFTALPLPASPTTPLLVQNEIITLPSASTIAIQRRQLQNRPLAAKKLAVIADPVFNLKDSRLTGIPPQQTRDTLSSRSLTRATRNLGLGDTAKVLDRLEFTGTEAKKILALVPATQSLQALDFNASRTTTTDPKVAQYQIIHLATHGLLDTINPELSGIVLSLFDQKGKPLDGFLRLHDIFNLNLPAELVVLSACQTGLGKDVKGEGLVGLTRGFMYAGARRVVVSLWSVNDVATSEAMAKFYQKMLQDGQNPVTALRAAQLEMWKSQQWQSPYFWAAFTVQGDWR